MAKFIFLDSAEIKQQVTLEQAEKLKKIYKNQSQEIVQKISDIKNDKSGLRTIQLNQLLESTNKSLSNITKQIKKSIKDNSTIVVGAVTNDAKKFATKIGLKAGGAYANVPDKVVKQIMTGQVYQKGWTLSKALWKDEQQNRQAIQDIVTAGVAGNKSTYDIAKDLEIFVDPSAKKPWNWGKVYPNSNKTIDYNAQRLARTMVNHAYQQGVKESIKDNPFIDLVRWLSAMSHRSCEMCKTRNNKLFEKDKVPLDHPNGMCTLAPYVEYDLESYASEIKVWKNSPVGSFPGIDKYAESLGYDIKTKTPMAAKKAKKVESKEDLQKALSELQQQYFGGILTYADYEIKSSPIKNLLYDLDNPSTKPAAKVKALKKPQVTSTSPPSDFDLQQWNDNYQAMKYRAKHSKLYGATDELADAYNSWINKISIDEKEAIQTYTGAGFGPMNRALRGKRSASDEIQRYIENGKSAMSKASLPEEIFTGRGIDIDALLESAGHGDKDEMWLATNYKSLINSPVYDKAFVSTSITDPWQKEVEMILKVPKGYPAVYVDQISWNKGEYEILLDADVVFLIKDIVQEGSYKYKVYAEVLPK